MKINPRSLLLIILLSMPAFSIWAQKPVYFNNQKDGSDFCTQCSARSQPFKTTQQQVNSLKVIIENASQSISDINDSLEFAEKCDNFADEDGLGKYGDIVLKEFKKGNFSELYRGTNDLVELCPNFNRLENAEKELVYVNILNAMAHLESSCDKSEKGKGPYGTAVGLLQLNSGNESDAAEGCRDGDGSSVEGTIHCGLAILNLQFSKHNELFTNESHWEVLRPNIYRKSRFKHVSRHAINRRRTKVHVTSYQKVQAAIQRYALCNSP